MKFIINLGLVITLLITSCSNNSTSPYDLVDPFIGTGGHGHTFPGATLPFGMVQLSPDTRLEGWDGCSGYHFSDSVIYGFSHTHLSGTGVSDYGDVLLMPVQGEIYFDNGYKGDSERSYASSFRKKSEMASPGFYGVHLDKHNIDVRLSATLRTGIHEYTFNREAPSSIILDLQHRDELIKSSIQKVSSNEIEGNRISKAWAQEQHIYFVIRFSQDFDYIINDSTGTKAALSFNEIENGKLLVKVGISATSIDGARRNLEAEANSWEMEEYLRSARKEWESALAKIEIEDPNSSAKTIFYTALYHSMIAPNTFSDVDGNYRGMDQIIHSSEDGDVYTVFSLWDTFRATHPLYTIIEQERSNAFIRTFLLQYQQGGELPIWELAANYTGCMIGYHSIPVITDAYMKGIRDYDSDLALEAMIHSAMQDKLGLDAYKNQGYISSEDEPESVSKTLEYAYDDWCIALLAKQLNEDSIYSKFLERAQYYKNIYNPENGFMQSKLNGGWSIGFDPAEVNFNFTEANSWQYSLFAPQDISGLIQLYGGEDKFEKQLDQLFTTNTKLTGRSQSDITGLIGQYAHGNEPSHHMAYLYDYIGKAYKTQERVNQILSEQYQNTPDGLSGNEDCGQMSSWYVLSSMGFYSVSPGENYYAIGSPLFEKVQLNLENGNTFIIKAKNRSPQNIYIQSATLNGKDFNQSYLLHQSIMNGGELVFEMGAKANPEWAKNNSPKSAILTDYQIAPSPYFSTSKQTFEDSLLIELKTLNNNAEVFYRINNSDYQKLDGKIALFESAEVTAYSIQNGKRSKEIKASYIKIPKGRSIELITPYSNQYIAAGDNTLIDYLKGGDDFRTGYWQGYYNTDFEAIVDLGTRKKIKTIAIGALKDIKSWIWFPSSINFYGSNDDEHYTELGNIISDFPPQVYSASRREFKLNFSTPITYRYIKIKAKNFGDCPEWHPGNGNPTWLFFDEITIE
jgi:predicted alpha-1,2-mannosidase